MTPTSRRASTSNGERPMSRTSPSSASQQAEPQAEIAVDLPAPFGPSTASSSPRRTSQVEAVERDGLAVALARTDELRERLRGRLRRGAGRERDGVDGPARRRRSTAEACAPARRDDAARLRTRCLRPFRISPMNGEAHQPVIASRSSTANDATSIERELDAPVQRQLRDEHLRTQPRSAGARDRSSTTQSAT